VEEVEDDDGEQVVGEVWQPWAAEHSRVDSWGNVICDLWNQWMNGRTRVMLSNDEKEQEKGLANEISAIRQLIWEISWGRRRWEVLAFYVCMYVCIGVQWDILFVLLRSCAKSSRFVRVLISHICEVTCVEQNLVFLLTNVEWCLFLSWVHRVVLWMLGMHANFGRFDWLRLQEEVDCTTWETRCSV
jgi:hypothetical protein